MNENIIVGIVAVIAIIIIIKIILAVTKFVFKLVLITVIILILLAMFAIFFMGGDNPNLSAKFEEIKKEIKENLTEESQESNGKL